MSNASVILDVHCVCWIWNDGTESLLEWWDVYVLSVRTCEACNLCAQAQLVASGFLVLSLSCSRTARFEWLPCIVFFIWSYVLAHLWIVATTRPSSQLSIAMSNVEIWPYWSLPVWESVCMMQSPRIDWIKFWFIAPRFSFMNHRTEIDCTINHCVTDFCMTGYRMMLQKLLHTNSPQNHDRYRYIQINSSGK